MHTSPIENHQPDHERGAFVSPFGRSTPDCLALPRLDNVPATFSDDQFGAKWARMALLWLDAGELTDDDSGHPRELVQTAVKRWMQRQLAGTNHLDKLEIYLNPTIDPWGCLDDSQFEGNPEDYWMFSVGNEECAALFELEPGITALEQAHPGLGHTALQVFDDKAGRLLPMFTPVRARETAEYHWWNGVESQEDFREELECMYGGDQDAVEDALTHGPDAFDAAFPDWMFTNPESRKTLSDEDLQCIADSDVTDQAKAVARLLLELRQIDSGSYRLPWLMGQGPVPEENIYYAAVIRWNKDDMVCRLLDDRCEYANQCSDSFTDLLGADAVLFDQDGFNQWKTEVEAGFAVFRKLDALLPLIAAPFVWEE